VLIAQARKSYSLVSCAVVGNVGPRVNIIVAVRSLVSFVKVPHIVNLEMISSVYGN
jgi:hypothetical protein